MTGLRVALGRLPEDLPEELTEWKVAAQLHQRAVAAAAGASEQTVLQKAQAIEAAVAAATPWAAGGAAAAVWHSTLREQPPLEELLRRAGTTVLSRRPQEYEQAADQLGQLIEAYTAAAAELGKAENERLLQRAEACRRRLRVSWGDGILVMALQAEMQPRELKAKVGAVKTALVKADGWQDTHPVLLARATQAVRLR